MLTLDRRTIITGLGALAAVALVPTFSLAQSGDPGDLLTPGPLGDKVLGSENAKVTVVEYASMTCPHCGQFHRDTFKAFREKYIDSGQVRFIFREFPLDAAAAGVSMLARCAPEDRYFDMLDVFFERQSTWLSAEDMLGAMFGIAQQFGFTKQSFEECLKNQALFEQLDAVKNRGAALGVSGTPTFFINGEKKVGALTIAELEAAIDPLL